MSRPEIRFSRLWRVDMVFLLGAVGAVAITVPRSLSALPHWTPIAAIGLASVPILIRFGIAFETRNAALRMSTAPAVIFAYDIDSDVHILPMWSVLVLVSYVIFAGRRDGPGRAAAEILSVSAMIAVAREVDIGLWPLDRVAVAITVYVIALTAVEFVRMRARGEHGLFDGIRRDEVTVMIGGLGVASVMFALTRNAYDTHPSLAMALTGGGCLLLFVIAQVLIDRLQAHMRGLSTLAAAAAAMPWPAGYVDRWLVRFVDEALRAEAIRVQQSPGGGADLSLPVRERGYLVASRHRGDAPFTAADKTLMATLIQMAVSSRDHGLDVAKLRNQATTDQLTGLPAYFHFRDLIEQHGAQRSREHRLALIFADMDDFKSLNTRLGHLDADTILTTLGARLRNQLPATVLACRFAGDEFVFLAEDVSDDSALTAVVDGIRAVFEEPFTVGTQLVRVTASIGTATSMDVSEDLDLVLRRAEMRMRTAKAERTSPILLSHQALIERLIAEGSITVAYQPLVALDTGEVQGIEALLRVIDPVFGTLTPLTVVDAALRGNMLDQLTLTVALQAIDVAARLSKALGARSTLTLNIEFGQLRSDSSLLRRLPSLLAHRDVTLVLEVSERSPDRWTPETRQVAAALSEAGIGLAIDDFGAGFATYSLLNEWSWDLVKIDRSLVARAHPDGRRLLAHVVGLLADLQRATIIEGIETAEDLEFARQLGADWGQGNGLAPPMSEAMLLTMITQSRFLSTVSQTAVFGEH